VHTGNFDDCVAFDELGGQTMTEFLRTCYEGTVIACGGYDQACAAKGIADGAFDLVAFGRPFIANPSLIQQLKQHAPLSDYESSLLETLY
jgi:N-ethylmaleimide reductase